MRLDYSNSILFFLSLLNRSPFMRLLSIGSLRSTHTLSPSIEPVLYQLTGDLYEPAGLPYGRIPRYWLVRGHFALSLLLTF